MQIRENISLKPYNTFGIDAKARFFASFQNKDELDELLTKAKGASQFHLVLGGGSNILLTKDVDGMVMKNEVMGPV